MDSHLTESGQCRRPPALDDLDLIAAADGEARADVLAHLAICDHCAARAQTFSALQTILRQRLFRAFCPSADDLVAYQHNMLSNGRRAAVANHLTECPHCAREMQLIARAAHDPPQPPSPLRFVRRVVAELLTPRTTHALVPLYGAARSPMGAQFAYRADNLELTLRVERAAGRSGVLVMSGSLTIEDDSIAVPPGGATACLLCDESVMAVAPLDELGGFLFDGVTPGQYSLSLSLGDCEVVVESLAL